MQENLMSGNNTISMNLSDLKIEWQNKHVLIVGAGATGLSCAKFLQSNQIDFKLVDSRPELNGIQADFNIELGDFSELTFTKADILIVSPGVSIQHALIQKAMQSGKEIIGDVELFSRLATKPIIAITGSNGKSTVTTLVTELLNSKGIVAEIGGNIGIPCLDLLDKDFKTDCYVLELSSFQLETTNNLKTIASIILNLSEDHMDRYDSRLDYFLAKKKILSNAMNIVVNLDDSNVVDFCSEFDSNKITISLENKTADFHIEKINNTEYIYNGESVVMDLSNIKLVGEHNKLNILAALALTSVLDSEIKETAEVVNNFTGLAHRSQEVSRHNQLQWINDSKATNIGATIAALNGFKHNSIHLILGGQGKGQDFSELASSLTENIKHIYIYGEDAEIIFNTLKECTNINITSVNTLTECIALINSSAIADDIVLFSPACASFDQFDNYMQRGEYFVDAIKRLGA